MPDRSEQVVFTDHAVAVLNQIRQKIEHLRFDGDRRRAATQFPAVCVKGIILE
jgi:hypothetical protein